MEEKIITRIKESPLGPGPEGLSKIKIRGLLSIHMRPQKAIPTKIYLNPIGS